MKTTDWTAALGDLLRTMPGDNNQQNPAQDNNGHSLNTDAHSNPGAKFKGIVHTLFYERKGRGGKLATIIAGLEKLDDSTIASLASDIKKALATGGSSRGAEILLQGDCREKLRKLLPTIGFEKIKG